MVREQLTRRRVLRTSGQLAAVGTVASAAGCLSDVPVVGSFFGPGVTPKKWVAAPGTFEDRDHGRYSFSKPKALLDNEEHLADNIAENLNEPNTNEEIADLDPEDVTAAVFSDPYTVAAGSFNNSDVTSELEDNDFDDEGDHEGYTVYVAADDSDYAGRAVGVGNTLVFGRRAGQDTDAQEVVETAIDVGKGNEDRYADESDAMKTLMNKAGTPHIAFGNTQEAPDDTDEDNGVFEDNVATGRTWKVNGENSTFKYIYVFDDSDAADKGAVEDYSEELEDQDGSLVSEADSVNVNKSGKAVIIKLKVPTDEVFADS